MLHGILPLRPVEAIVGAVAPLEDRIGAEGILPLPQNHQVAEREPFQAAPARGNAHLLPLLEFPSFDGEAPREWISKCDKLFKTYAIPNDQKVNLVVIGFERRPDVWFEGWKYGKSELVWEDFVVALCQRFGSRTYGGVVAAFNKLRKQGSLAEYQERFEELRSLMSRFNPALDEIFFISSFINGLKQELRLVMSMLQPQTLAQAYRQAKLEEDAIEDFKRKKQSQLGDYLEMDVDISTVTVESLLSPNMVDGNGGLLAEKEYIPIVTPGSTVKEPGLFYSELQGVSNKHMEVAGYVYDEGSRVHSWMLMNCHRYSCPRVKFKQGDTCINYKEPYVEALGTNAVGDCFSSDNGATETQVQQNLIYDDTDVLPVDSLEYRSSYGVVFSDGSLMNFPDTGGNDFVIGRPFPTQPALLFIHYSEGLIPGKGDCILLKFHGYWWPRVKIKRSDVFSNFKEPYNDLGSKAVVGFDAELLLLRSKLLSRRGGQNACVGVVAEAIFSGDYERYSVGVSKMDKGFFAYVNEIGSLDHSWVLVSSHGLWCPRVQLKRKVACPDFKEPYKDHFLVEGQHEELCNWKFHWVWGLNSDKATNAASDSFQATFLASLKVHTTIITSSAAVPLREDDISNTFSIYGLEKHGIGRGIGLLMAQGKVQQAVFMIGLEDAVDLQHVNGDRMIGGRFDSCLVLGESQGRGIGFDFKEPYKEFGWAMVLSYGRGNCPGFKEPYKDSSFEEGHVEDWFGWDSFQYWLL
ncbi:unnamed protein product [Linum trigynum]|uniref:Ty3 transposon capsid-like protein domain-containing protein n=1 Tax=Linum trigynum TaxID=586398 RepID=A0AAV2ERA9_9ROSI